jgi:hypothetical protein
MPAGNKAAYRKARGERAVTMLFEIWNISNETRG